MELILEREIRLPGATAGTLYWHMEDEGGRVIRICDTLEDQWRDLANGEKKIAGKTCIPDGTYRVRMDVVSPKYVKKFRACPGHKLAYTKGYMPRLEDVPQFEGVLIHTGNTADDTEGCILVGTRDERDVTRLVRSTEAFVELYRLLASARCLGEEITITITTKS